MNDFDEFEEFVGMPDCGCDIGHTCEVCDPPCRECGWVKGSGSHPLMCPENMSGSARLARDGYD